MRVFGYDLSVKKLVQKSSIVPSVGNDALTSYVTPTTGTIIDGRKIQRHVRNYYALYRQNTDLRRCVEEIIQTAGKGGYKYSKYLGNGKVKTVDNVFMDDFISNSGGWKKLKAQMSQQMLISGSLFLRKKVNARKKVFAVEVLDTRYITVITDNYFEPLRYLYRHPAAKSGTYELTKEEVFTYQLTPDIDNPIWGMSAIETLVIDLTGDEEANLANLHFFANDAIPSSLFVLNQNMSLDEKNQAIEYIKEKMSGGHNKHKMLSTDAIVDIKPVAQQHKDMDFVTQRKFTTERVCAAMGVPKVILGYTEGVNYSNAKEQYTKFIENTIRPFEDALEEIMNMLMAGNESVEFCIVDDHIDDYDERSKTAERHVAAGLWTRNEAREYIGNERIENPLMDEITVTSSTVLLESLPEMGANAVPMQPDETDV